MSEPYALKKELLSNLNMNRKVSEKNVKKVIKEDNICNEIKGLIYSTINISREQINTQNDVIYELRKEIENLTIHSDSLKRQLDRSRRTSIDKEKSLNDTIMGL